jgi:hypothetical protein
MSGRADPETESDQPAPRTRRSHRLLKVAALGGAVALVLNQDLRNQLLNALFGAEEEFSYSSVTEPLAEETLPDDVSEPWVRAAAPGTPAGPGSEPAVAEAEGATTHDGDSPWTEGVGRPASVSPSPAAWRAAAEEAESVQAEAERHAPEPMSEAAEAEAESDEAASATPDREPATTEPEFQVTEPEPHEFEPEPAVQDSAAAESEPEPEVQAFEPAASEPEPEPYAFEPAASEPEPESDPYAFEPAANESGSEPAAQDFEPYATTEPGGRAFEPDATAPETETEQHGYEAAESSSPPPYRPNPRQDRPSPQADRPGPPPDAPRGWWSPRTTDGDQHDS